MVKYDLTISIVTYKNNPDVLKKTVNSVLNSNNVSYKLYIIDNSPSNNLQSLFNDKRIEYQFNGANVGFGAGHNIILNDKSKLGRYHLVLNPDVYFGNDILAGLVDYMNLHEEVGNITPKVYYPNGTLCPVCRLLPTPKDLILRMFIPFKSWRQKIGKKFLMNFCSFEKPVNSPFLSGCFMFLRTSIVDEVGVFDEHMFMYAEDVDLNRRIHRHYKTLYYPSLAITHYGKEESHTNWRLVKIHIRSCIYYFNKWGWLFDKERNQVNKRALLENS